MTKYRMLVVALVAGAIFCGGLVVLNFDMRTHAQAKTTGTVKGRAAWANNKEAQPRVTEVVEDQALYKTVTKEFMFAPLDGPPDAIENTETFAFPIKDEYGRTHLAIGSGEDLRKLRDQYTSLNPKIFGHKTMTEITEVQVEPLYSASDSVWIVKGFRFKVPEGVVP